MTEKPTMTLDQAMVLLRRAKDEVARAESVYDAGTVKRFYELPWDLCVATDDSASFYLLWLEGETGMDASLRVDTAFDPADWDAKSFDWKQLALNPNGSWTRRTVVGFVTDRIGQIFGTLDCGHQKYDGRKDYRVFPLRVGQECVCDSCRKFGTGFFEETGTEDPLP